MQVNIPPRVCVIFLQREQLVNSLKVAFRFELCAMEGRSTHEGKAGLALSASLSGGVTHAGRSVFWSDHAENKGLSPLGLAPHSLTSSCGLLFFVPKRVCLRMPY